MQEAQQTWVTKWSWHLIACCVPSPRPGTLHISFIEMPTTIPLRISGLQSRRWSQWFCLLALMPLCYQLPQQIGSLCATSRAPRKWRCVTSEERSHQPHGVCAPHSWSLSQGSCLPCHWDPQAILRGTHIEELRSPVKTWANLPCRWGTTLEAKLPPHSRLQMTAALTSFLTAAPRLVDRGSCNSAKPLLDSWLINTKWN